MKKYTGYIIAAAALVFTAVITLFAKKYGQLLDAFYPYVSRTIQGVLASFSHLFPFTLWQVIVVVLVVLAVITLILSIRRKHGLIRWLGWVLAVACLLWTGHTTIHGLNFYAGSLAEDLRLELIEPTQEEMENALIYFRDQANALAQRLPRDENGDLLYDSFETLAEKAGAGFQTLRSRDGYAVFAGSTLPVKKLAWSKLYNAMGICGVTMALTGEAAVVADMPNMALPFVMCHEMAHRMAIALEDDANFAAFLACQANDDPQFQYAAYYMAYRYCYNALGGSAAAQIHEGADPLLRRDLKSYHDFYAQNNNQAATDLADKINNTYIQVSGDKDGVKSYGMVAIQLVSWYHQQTAQPEQTAPFDPTDTDYINGIIGETHE